MILNFRRRNPNLELPELWRRLKSRTEEMTAYFCDDPTFLKSRIIIVRILD
ncbi:MAG: hypothetical protein K2J11_00015 [Oscillospiraceae bacterium]|nr:hypothetical protein [Oscillospiraceae bacterium]